MTQTTPSNNPTLLGPPVVNIEIKLDRILETAMVGYRRAAVFMGLGCNAARREDFIDYHLDHATNFKVLPESVDSATLKEWKSEFYQWSVSNGLREVVDFTNVFLDQVYEAAAILIEHRRESKKLKKFQHSGLGEKLDFLKNRFGLSCRFPDAVASVGKVRNCLVHRLGVVGPEDVGASGGLVLTWFGMEMIYVGDDGTEYPGPQIAQPNGPDWRIPCPGTFAARLKMLEKHYSLGEKLVLDPHTLNQVLFSMQLMAGDYIRNLTELARKDGSLKEI